MIGASLRHLRVFLSVAECGSITEAAARNRVTQPAVTQAVAKLEHLAGVALFSRTPQGFFLTEAGEGLRHRVARAIGRIDEMLSEIAPRLRLTVTRAQLQSLIAVAETQNFTLAARQLGISQPTVHRAVSQLEQETGRPLFQRTSFGSAPTRPCQGLVQAAKLAFAELEQAEAELGERLGREVGRIVVGAMPLARSYILPRALSRFREQRPLLPVSIVDGPYDALLAGLRRGETDFLIGALRDPLPIEDVEQRPLFTDTLVLLAGAGHPLLRAGARNGAALAAYPWVVPRQGTPARRQFEAMFLSQGLAPPESIVETGSVMLMREMLEDGRSLACISRAQALQEIRRGLVRELPVQVPASERTIGITTRVGWVPTPAQQLLLDRVRDVVEFEGNSKNL